MVELSEHTKLMNVCLGLFFKVNNYPTYLTKDLNYHIESIEPTFVIDNVHFNPDFIVTSKKHSHTIIFECKEKNIENKQKNKYIYAKENPKKMLTLTNIIDTKGINQDLYEIDAIYVSFNDLSQYAHPLGHITISCSNVNTCITLTGDLSNKKIKNYLTKVTISAPPIYNLYPYDITLDRDEGVAIIFLMRKFVTFSQQNKTTFTTEELISADFPCWSHIDTKKQKKFISRIDQRLKQMSNNELKQYLTKEKDSWSININPDPKTLPALQRQCEKIIEKIDSPQQLLEMPTEDKEI